MKPRHSLIAIAFLLLLPLQAAARPAAQASFAGLRLTADPPVLTPGQSVTVTLKNFNWARSARLNTTLTENDSDASVPLAEGLMLGPRRRAALPAAIPSPGLWVAQAEGQWLFGEETPSLAINVLVGTAGSTVGQINLDQTVQGSLQPDSAWQDGDGLGGWAFDLAEVQRVIIQAHADGGTELGLVLIGDEAQIFEEEDGAAVVFDRELQPGRYLIAVVSETATAYTLTLSSGLSGDNDGGPIAPGTVVPGLLAPADDSDSFTFAAAPGDVVYAAMTAADAALDPYLELLDPAGNLVASNDDTNGFNAALSYIVPLAGDYTLRLTSNAGSSTGSYTLEVAHDPDMARLRPGTTTELGQVVRGHVEPGGAQAWRFSASGGALVGLLAESRSNGFDANLTLYGPDGTQLAFSDDDGGNRNPLINAALPADGFYTVVAGSYTGVGGTYDLTLSAEPLTAP